MVACKNKCLQKWDNLTYRYDYSSNGTGDDLLSNWLYHVNDAVGTTAYTLDIEDQGTFSSTNATINTANNYGYDNIGNLVRDDAEAIDNISWNMYGKISHIERTSSSGKQHLWFRYGPDGQRVHKKAVEEGTSDTTFTWYLRDASGNIMATYTLDISEEPRLDIAEHHLYGSSRLGYVLRNKPVEEWSFKEHGDIVLDDPLDYDTVGRTLGYKFYELTNHLGNVLVVVTGQKIPVPEAEEMPIGGDPILYWLPNVVRAQDYYPFGMLQPGRYWWEEYRFGFNGQERDNEVAGEGNSYSAEFWQYDSRIGRRWNVDPVVKEWESSFATFSNNPIFFIDPQGDNASDFYDKDGSKLFHIEDGSNAKYTLTGDDKSNEYFEFSGYDESQGGVNEVNVGGAIEGAQKYVLENYTSVKSGNGWQTFCNYGCMNVSKTANSAAIANGSELPNINLVNGQARTILSNLAKLSPVTLTQAKTDAASGYLVIGGWGGHVFTLRADGLINNVGSMSAAPKNNVFDPQYAPSSVKFYTFKPKIAQQQPIKTYGTVELPAVQVQGNAPEGWNGGFMTPISISSISF